MMTALLKTIELADLFANPSFRECLDAGEILELHEKYGPINFFHAKLAVNKTYFDSWYNILNVKKNRRAEVALYVENYKRQVLLHTKPFYPQDIYRIPTGGIHPGEKAITALHRELDEETGFTARSFQQLALLVYEFRHDSHSLFFPSYIYRVLVDGLNPHPKDNTENITGYRWISTDQLSHIFDSLQALPERWRDWGIMRALPHNIIYDSLERTGI